MLLLVFLSASVAFFGGSFSLVLEIRGGVVMTSCLLVNHINTARGSKKSQRARVGMLASRQLKEGL